MLNGAVLPSGTSNRCFVIGPWTYSAMKITLTHSSRLKQHKKENFSKVGLSIENRRMSPQIPSI